MFIARWQIDARFGHKATTVELMRKWEREIGPQVGLPEMEFLLLSGSIGAREATIEANHKVESLAQLEQFFEKIRRDRGASRLGAGARAVGGLGQLALADLPGALTARPPMRSRKRERPPRGGGGRGSRVGQVRLTRAGRTGSAAS